MRKKIIRLTENELKNFIKESVKKIINEIDNPWLSTADDRNGKYTKTTYFSYENFLYDNEIDETPEGDEFYQYMKNGEDKNDITKLVYSISWYDEPSVNASGENLEEIYGYDKLEQYIKNFPNKQIAEMALEYLEKYYVEEYEDTLELVDIDEVPDYD